MRHCKGPKNGEMSSSIGKRLSQCHTPFYIPFWPLPALHLLMVDVQKKISYGRLIIWICISIFFVIAWMLTTFWSFLQNKSNSEWVKFLYGNFVKQPLYPLPHTLLSMDYCMLVKMYKLFPTSSGKCYASCLLAGRFTACHTQHGCQKILYSFYGQILPFKWLGSP
jgi:hypothetical protein